MKGPPDKVLRGFRWVINSTSTRETVNELETRYLRLLCTARDQIIWHVR